jgi:hypothetical protein
MRFRMIGGAGTLMALLAAGCVSHVSYVPMESPPRDVAGLDAVVYLLGDAGEGTPGRDAVLAHLRSDLERRLRESPDASVLVAYLGDNIYDVGAREEYKAEDLAKLTVQVDAVRELPRTQAVFLPGNHDWARGAGNRVAQEAIRVQQAWLSEIAPDSTARFLPTDGCPGPSTMHVAGDVHVLFIDTEWLLRRPDDACGSSSDFYERLQRRLEELAGQRVILAAHHPMATGGPHGGNAEPFARGPFIQYFATKTGTIAQDLSSGRYSAMIDSIQGAIERSGNRPLAFVAGHDHSLQVIKLLEANSPYFQLVSGSAAKTSPVGTTDGMRFATESHGYMRLDFTPSSTRLVVFAEDPSRSGISAVFSCEIVPADGPPSCPVAQLADGGT